MLTVLECLAAIVVGYVIVRYIVLPAMRKSDGNSTGVGSANRERDKTDRL